ncbi:MAG: hypothetical protein LBI20_03485 [Holosporales bacterium]|jgi:F0F1-type ATP synthase membrane subunit b/b'|nr:hypothetical protein [Holosporales bacterium]
MMPQLDSSYFFSQCFWLCVSLTVLVIAFKGYFIPKMDKICHSRDHYMEECSNSIEKLDQKISDEEEMIRRAQEDELRRAAEIVINAVKKYENDLDTQLKCLKTENEARLSATRDRIYNEIKGLESIFQTQVKMTAQVAFEQLFLRKF